MKKVHFSFDAIHGMQKFKSGQQNFVFKIFELIEDIQKTPFEGKGKIYQND